MIVKYVVVCLCGRMSVMSVYVCMCMYVNQHAAVCVSVFVCIFMPACVLLCAHVSHTWRSHSPMI